MNPNIPIIKQYLNIIILPYLSANSSITNSEHNSPKNANIEFKKKFPFIFPKFKIIPSKIRNITFSYASLAGRILPILVPILTKIMPSIIDYTFLFAGILSGFIGITLEEILGKKIMDVIPEEIEEYRNTFKMELLDS